MVIFIRKVHDSLRRTRYSTQHSQNMLALPGNPSSLANLTLRAGVRAGETELCRVNLQIQIKWKMMMDVWRNGTRHYQIMMTLIMSYPSRMDETIDRGGGFTSSILMLNMYDLCL